jgi:hypothetical protein
VRKGSSEYLMIDFCWQLHSRNKNDGLIIEMDYKNLIDIMVYFLFSSLIYFVFMVIIFGCFLHKHSTKKEIVRVSLLVSVMEAFGGLVDKFLNIHMKRLITCICSKLLIACFYWGYTSNT